MAPIRAQARTAQTAPGAEGEPEGRGEPAGASGVRRGRHRKPRPRKVLLAAGGLALAAGVLSLVRVSPESGVGAPGTAEAEPRAGAGGGTTDHASNAAATVSADPTALPSATSVMGGRSPAPTPTGTRTGPAAKKASPSGTAVPTATALPTAPGTTSATTPRPSVTTSAPRPAPTTTPPAPTTPSPSHSTADPGPGGLCVPVLGLCVDVH
ncbi:hypothetical protein ABT167_03460 [Streptomyces sp. NPDC001792]|uniref:hypothetical protein n=1 Tax=Streptomyces sp. NPDC001792 TaxID=3154524 RepID=UPI0033297DC4